MAYFAKGFGKEAGNGDFIRGESEDGFCLRAEVHHDDDMGPPWKEHDYYGPVREVRVDFDRRPIGKAPGERVLYRDNHTAVLYDWQGAIALALKDGWGPRDPEPGLTRRQRAALAVEQDFDFLRRWANDEWAWVGVTVDVTRNGIRLTEDYEFALWGIESCAGEHLSEVAEDLAGEALEQVRRKLSGLFEEVFGGSGTPSLHA